VVWFGDAAGHDPDLGHTLTEAIEALQAAHIKVIAVPVHTFEPGLDSTGQATRVAMETGGEVLPEATPEEVSTKILEGLKNLPVTVTPTPMCDTGLTASYDAPSKTVTSGEEVTFEETLSVASNAPDGDVLNCTVDFLLNENSVEGFQQKVAITVPLRPTDLSIEKAITPVFFFKKHLIAYTLTVTNSGSDPDNNVTITDPLPHGTHFVVADPGCTFAAGVVTCDLGTLAPGASTTKLLVLGVTKCSPPKITNTATVTGERPDSNPANNSSSVTTYMKRSFSCCPSHSHGYGGYGFGGKCCPSSGHGKYGGYGFEDKCCSRFDKFCGHGSKRYGPSKPGKHRY